MPSIQVMQSLDAVRSALERKGFDELLVTHYENTPVGHVVVHDDHGQLARGDQDQILQILEEAEGVREFWSALDRANLTRKSWAGKS